MLQDLSHFYGSGVTQPAMSIDEDRDPRPKPWKDVLRVHGTLHCANLLESPCSSLQVLLIAISRQLNRLGSSECAKHRKAAFASLVRVLLIASWCIARPTLGTVTSSLKKSGLSRLPTTASSNVCRSLYNASKELSPWCIFDSGVEHGLTGNWVFGPAVAEVEH